jgi:outer membrane protein assembly factor BamB
MIKFIFTMKSIKKNRKTFSISAALSFFLSSCILIFFFSSCTQEPAGGGQPSQQQQQQQQQPIQTIPTYNQDVKPILDGKCIGCHKQGGTAGFSPLTSYDEVVNGTARGSSCQGTQNSNYVVPGNPDSSLLYLKITNPPCGGKMPLGGSLSQSEIDTIKNWISAGAPEKGTQPTPPSNLQVSAVSSSEISLSWTDSPDEKQYRIKRKKQGDVQFSVIATLPKDTTSYRDTGLSAGTQYCYIVCAVNEFGETCTGEKCATTQSATTGGGGGGGGGGGYAPLKIKGKPSTLSIGKFIFKGTSDGKVLAYSREGDIVWSYSSGTNSYFTPPAICEGKVITGGGNGVVLALDEENGKVLWQYNTGVSNYMVSCDDENVYFGTFSGELYSLSKSGNFVWKKKLSDARIVAYPAIYKDMIAVGTEDGMFFVINKKTQNIIFTYKMNEAIREGAVFDDEGNIYIASYDQNVYSFTPSGQLRWSFKTSGGMYSSCALWYYKDSLVCTIGSKDGQVYTLDANSGKLIWKVAIGPVSIGAIVGNYIWFSTDDDRLVAISKAGEIYFNKIFEEIYYSSPLIFDGKVFVANDEDKIFYIPYSENLISSPWPAYRQNLQRTGYKK